MEILNDLWAHICEWYQMYSGFIHSIFPSQLGDLVEGVLDIAVACLVIKVVSSVAFGTKNKG